MRVSIILVLALVGSQSLLEGTSAVSIQNVKKVQKQVDKKIYVHLMPWFETKQTNPEGIWGQHWTMVRMDPDKIIGERNKQEIAAWFYPDIHPYGSGDSALIDYQIQMMKYAGVDGVFIDWPGTADVWDYAQNLKNADKFIKKTAAAGLTFAIVYEDHNLGMAYENGFITDILGQGRKDMEFLRDNYFGMSNYIQVNGAPLMMTFGPQTLRSPGDWTSIFATLPTKPTFLTLWNQMEEAGDNAKGEYPWIYVNFMLGLTNFYNYREIDLKFGVAYPGFQDFYQEGGWPGHPGWRLPFEDNGSLTFSNTLQLALNYSDINYIQAATWNDYGEGTMIEPTREFGNQFLNVLQSTLGVPYGDRELNLIKDLYNKRKAHVGRADYQNIFDQVNEALNDLDPNRAEKLLNTIP